MNEGIFQITSADLLQANITMIAGILILLTVSIVYKKESSLALFFATFSPMVFVASIVLLIAATTPDYNSDNLFGIAKTAFLAGLCYLLLSVILIVRSIAKQSKEPNQSS